ncbi:MAG: RNA polymerase sigma factor [Solirubrobacterales bacterium]|nr:RNA polymerase sigma factor [Solirubrobacterales bacterium]
MRRTTSSALELLPPRASAKAPALDEVVRARFRDGDPEAVRAVYGAYGRLVYAVAHRVLRDRGLSEEATQETFVKAWRGARRLDPGRELGPWLMTIAKRVAIDLHRREARRPRRLESFPTHDRALVSPRPSIEYLHDIWEVRRAISALPDAEREVVRLQHLEGLAHAQIAERLALPLGTVKSRSFRAHRRLAAELEDTRADRGHAAKCPQHENRVPGAPVLVCE